MYRILIVEDDAALGGGIARVLTDRGYTPALAEDLTDIMPRFRAFDPQLVILDLSLPYHNGYHWCRRLREVSDVPILFLSSSADSLNQVTAMDLGADDFVAKPLDAELLAARVQALLRRTYAYRRAADVADCAGVPLDLSAGEVKAAIRTQVLGVFFLPLAGAAVHLAAAAPMLMRMISVFGLADAPLFWLCAAGTLGVFALCYTGVYALTARQYYRIVRR